MSDEDFNEDFNDGFDEDDFGDIDDDKMFDSLGDSGSIPLDATPITTLPTTNGIVLTEDDVFVQMKDEAAKTGEIYALTPEEALQVMSRLEWVTAKLTEADDIPVLREKCGIPRDGTGLRSTRPYEGRTDLVCELCEEQGLAASDVYSLSCNHIICRDCWQQNIRVRLADYQPNAIECPGPGCKLALLDNDMRDLATKAQYTRYRSLFVQNFIRLKKNLIYCNSPSCDEVLKLRSLCTNDYQVKCRCGTVFCFNCCKNRLTDAGEGHYPATCDQFGQWLKKTEEGVFSFRKKPCPKCKVPIIKCGCPPGRVVCDELDHCPNQACNHMNCPSCQHHFCWICLKDWSGHGDYYNCKFVLPDEVRNREHISKYAEIYLKYKDYDGNRKGFLHGRDWAKQAFDRMRQEERTTRTNNFLLEAVEELAMCYHTLANSYVLFFYNDFEGADNVCPGVSKELFEYNQQNLESYTNKLSCKYEKEAKPLIESNGYLEINLTDELMRLTSIIHDYRRKLFSVEME